MTATPAKTDYDTSYADRYCGYKPAKQPAKSRPQPIPEPTMADEEARHRSYFREGNMRLAKDRVLVKKTVVIKKYYQRTAAFAPIGQPKLPRLLQVSPAPSAKQSPSAKAFTMHMEHLKYLTRVSTGDNAPITPQTAKLAQKAWQLIWLASDRAIPVPAACTGPDGKMFYSWDRGRHHLELEIVPNQAAEFFYRDRETGQLWGEDYRIGDPLSSEAVAKMRFFS